MHFNFKDKVIYVYKICTDILLAYLSNNEQELIIPLENSVCVV